MAKKPESDKQLIERVKKGDKNAFDLLVIKYQHKIFGLISNYIEDRHEIQDIAQETFVKAYKAIHNFRGDSAFYTWLYRIAVNTAKNNLIARNRKTPSLDIDIENAQFFDEDCLKDSDTPENLLNKEKMEKALFDVISRLPEGIQTTIRLREIEGLSYQEISKIMDCPIGTVRSRIFRARDIIDKSLMLFLQTED